MNVNYYCVFSVWSHFIHIFRSFETCSCVISYCVAFVFLTFSHAAVWILASSESIAGGTPNCRMGELTLCLLATDLCLKKLQFETFPPNSRRYPKNHCTEPSIDLNWIHLSCWIQIWLWKLEFQNFSTRRVENFDLSSALYIQVESVNNTFK